MSQAKGKTFLSKILISLDNKHWENDSVRLRAVPPAHTFSPSPPLTPGGACPPLPLITDKESDHYHLDHHLHLIVTLIRLATDSAFVQTWAKEAIWSWKAEVSTSFPSSPHTAHSCLPSSGLTPKCQFRPFGDLAKSKAFKVHTVKNPFQPFQEF